MINYATLCTFDDLGIKESIHIAQAKREIINKIRRGNIKAYVTMGTQLFIPYEQTFGLIINGRDEVMPDVLPDLKKQSERLLLKNKALDDPNKYIFELSEDVKSVLHCFELENHLGIPVGFDDCDQSKIHVKLSSITHYEEEESTRICTPEVLLKFKKPKHSLLATTILQLHFVKSEIERFCPNIKDTPITRQSKINNKKSNKCNKNTSLKKFIQGKTLNHYSNPEEKQPIQDFLDSLEIPSPEKKRYEGLGENTAKDWVRDVIRELHGKVNLRGRNN